MKKAKKLLVIACLGGVGYLLAKLLKTEAAQEKLFKVMGEDTYLAVLDKVELSVCREAVLFREIVPSCGENLLVGMGSE